MAAAITLSPREKALQINLDHRTYGSLAEIGAGQEVSALFFKAGAASGTIAKTISAYDMTFSDAIYGPEESGRYVCESRLMKMLNKEYVLLEKRLKGVRHPETLFFAFANTVVALNYKKSNESHGWIGMRFQLSPNKEPNDVVIHVRMLDNSNLAQQQAVGIIGINLIYGCFFYYENPELLLNSLIDYLGTDRIEIDMMRFTGPDFKHIDNRLISLQLVKNGLTKAALFNPKGQVLQPSEAFYKKNILILRGRFRPCTYVNQDMLSTGYAQFSKDKNVNPDNIITISELTLTSLQSEGDINEKDFLDRVEILCSLGHTVLISNYLRYYRLISYLAGFTKHRIGIILGILSLSDIFNEQYYTDLKGGILEAFATLFSRNVKLYVYPAKEARTGNIVTCTNFRLPENLFHLYKYLLSNDKLEDVVNYNAAYLNIISDDVLKMIKEGEEGWETQVPREVSEAIKGKKLFGYASNDDL
ncbi:MAG TPA: TonB-dependent receptor [Cytophagaceae bacterium]|jgi:hypothetical protein